MVQKKKNSLTTIALNMAVIIFTGVGVFHKIFSQFGDETQLAGKSMVKILILLAILGSLFSSIWFCLQIMIFLYLSSLHYSPYLALFIIIILNLILVLSIGWMINYIRENCFYPELRKGLMEVKNSFFE